MSRYCRVYLSGYLLGWVLISGSLWPNVGNAQANALLSDAERAFLTRHPVITLGTDRSWAPYVLLDDDGHISGYDQAILTAVNQLTGANFQLTTGRWDDIQHQALNRQIDGLSTVTANDQRRRYLSFSTPYLTLQRAVFVPTGNPLAINSRADLAGKTVAIQRGNMADVALARQFSGLQVLEVDQVSELFSALASGRADIIFGNGATFYIANRLGMPYMQTAFALDEQLTLSFAVRNDWPEALAILNKGLAALPAHEKIRLQAQWFSPTTTPDKRHAGLSPEEQQLIRQTTIKLCVSKNWLPFEGITRQGQHLGEVADLVRLLEQQLELNIQRIPSPNFSAITERLKSRQCDMVAALTPTAARAEYLNFTLPLIISPVVLATRLDQFFMRDLRQAIPGNRFAVVKDSATLSLLRTRYPGIQLVEVANAAQGLELVSAQQIFGFIGALDVIAYQVKAQHFLNLKISASLTDQYQLAIGVRNDWPQWIPILNKALQAIPANERRAIHTRWSGVQYTPQTDYRWLAATAVIITITVLLLIYRNRIISGYNTRLRQLNEQLEQQARTDQLTGLANRYLLNQELQREVASAERFHEIFSLVLLDIDHFKQINDHYGHQQGDAVLSQVSRLMQTRCRSSDILGRWGGEEFLLICPQTRLDDANQLAEQLRRVIEQQLIDQQVSVTLSAGVAEFIPGEPLHEMMRRLDQALYQAKHSGRNQVINAPGRP